MTYTPTHTATVHALRLKRALAFVQQTIERRNTIPVLGMVRIEFDLVCHVTVTGTDLDIELETNFQAANVTDAPFTLILPPRPLADFLRACDDELVTFAVNAERVIEISADGCTMSLRELCPPDDWPLFGCKGGDTTPQRTEIDGGLLHRALAAVVPCICTEETRYYLNGVYLHTKGNGMMLCATDGKRLALYKTDVPYPLPECILPAKTAKILQRALDNGKGAPITVEAWQRADGDGGARLRFAGDGWTISSKTIDASYPDYTRAIPKPDREVKISATISAAALRRLPTFNSLFMSQAVKIRPDAGRMSTTDHDITATAPVTGRGDAFGLNIQYLRAITYAAGTVKLEGLRPEDPFTAITEDPALSYTIMPMRVQ